MASLGGSAPGVVDGILSKTNELDTAKGQIWASPTLQNNFDDCVTLFQDFINNKRTATTRTSTIASIGTKRMREEGGGMDTEPDMLVDNRYYTGKEYAMLSKAKKLGLKLKRQKRGHKPGNKGKPRAAPKPTVGDRAMTRIVKALSKLIAANGQSEDEDNNDIDPIGPTDTATDTNASNRANKALQRRK